jgi:hypothetical protein
MDDSVPVKEADVARQLGMQRKALSDLRFEILTTDDWFREEGKKPESMRVVWIRPEGIAKLSAHLGLKTEEVAPKKIASAADAAEVRTFTVQKVMPRNPYLVEVLAENGEKGIMRVKDSTKWVKGMKVECRNGGNYTKWLIPLRNPRYRGRF